MIDPMDGTKQFVDRIDEFSVQIGLTIDGLPRLGIVYHAARDRMFYAAPGLAPMSKRSGRRDGSVSMRSRIRRPDDSLQ
jgi:3'(2'), 5'-bisphosphate nucleotidase